MTDTATDVLLAVIDRLTARVAELEAWRGRFEEEVVTKSLRVQGTGAAKVVIDVGRDQAELRVDDGGGQYALVGVTDEHYSYVSCWTEQEIGASMTASAPDNPNAGPNHPRTAWGSLEAFGARSTRHIVIGDEVVTPQLSVRREGCEPHIHMMATEEAADLYVCAAEADQAAKAVIVAFNSGDSIEDQTAEVIVRHGDVDKVRATATPKYGELLVSAGGADEDPHATIVADIGISVRPEVSINLMADDDTETVARVARSGSAAS